MAEVSIWAYPRDMHDLGLQTARDRIAGVGAPMVSLARSCHAGRFLPPGNPRRRVYFPQDGTVDDRPDPARYDRAEIAPMQAALVATEGAFATHGIDAFAQLSDRFADLEWRSEPISSLIRAIRGVVLRMTHLLLIEAEGSWAGGIDLPAILPQVDGILHSTSAIAGAPPAG